jgi:hypothetical protein
MIAFPKNYLAKQSPSNDVHPSRRLGVCNMEGHLAAAE